MIGELQQRPSAAGGGKRTVPGPVSPELLLFTPQPETNDNEPWDWELVSHLIKAYQGVAGGNSGPGQRTGSASKQREGPTHAAGPSSSATSRAVPGGEAGEISQFAHDLPGDALQLQEINQEDLAAILPDVSTPEGPSEDVAGPPFDGFEDVSSLGGKPDIGGTSTGTSGGGVASSCQAQAEAESSSEDMELLPEQVVSAAIQRIHVDEDTTSCNESTDPRLHRSGERADSYSSDDEEEEASDTDVKPHRNSARTIYSSRLLQQFEKTMLSQAEAQKNNASTSAESTSNASLMGSSKFAPKEGKTVPRPKVRRPRGRPPKNNVSVDAEEASSAGKHNLAELDQFMPLDCCNVSNVSPDSGIQSVAGSPVHQSHSPASNPAMHASPGHSSAPHSTSPAPMQQRSSSPPPKTSLTPPPEPKRKPGRPSKTPQLMKRRGPGRPKGSVNKKSQPADQRPERGVLETELPGYVPSTTSLSAGTQVPMKRGPGRPKKSDQHHVSPQGVGRKLDIVDKDALKGKMKLQFISDMVSNTLSKNLDSFLSRRSERKHELDTRFKGGKPKGDKRNKAKFSPEKRKNDRPAGKNRWRSNNIKALTVPFHIANSAALTVAVSHIKHMYPMKPHGSNRRKHGKASNNHQMGSQQGLSSLARHKMHNQKHKASKPLSQLMSQGKRKKKKKSNERKMKRKTDDPAFLSLLEELLISLNKCSISRTPSLPVPGENRLPSIFRVKRLLKRRKGSERPRNSDRESEGEAPTPSAAVANSAVAASGPPKQPHQPPKEKGKRKTKKSAVEPPKRAEPNEQRLPLKKRHYHLNNQAPTPSASLESIEEDRSSASPSSISPSSPNKTSPPTTSAAQTQTVSRVDKTQSSSRGSRNSIDEAIEACISRFSANKEILDDNNKSPVVTPKKRPRVEDAKVVDVEKVVTPPTPKISPTILPLLGAQKRSAALRASNQIASNFPQPSSAEKSQEAPDVSIKVEVKSEEVDSIKKSPSKTKSKKKLVKDVQPEIVKLNETDVLLEKAAAAVKKKVKRRKAINRTGFPVKKKKRPRTDAPTKNNGENVPRPKSQPEVKESAGESQKPVKESSKKRKIDPASSTSSGDTLNLAQSISKRLRGCKDDDASSTADETPLLHHLSESLFGPDVPSGDESTKSGRKKAPPRWRKKYLVAGLFSDYYKEDEPKKVTTAGDASKSRSLVYKPEDHIHGLLPPPYHCGKYLRQRRVDFQLPHDLWWLHMHNQLPGRDAVPSWNYKKIRTNVYYDVKPPYNNEAQACNCTPPQKPSQMGCGEDCINRLVYTECSTQMCPCKDRCANQKIQKHDWAPGIEKFMTKDKGWGVRTKKSIKCGEFILEYVGEVVSEKEFKNRMASRYVNDTHHYCLNLDGGLVIDGHRMGGDGRFVNHSCEPNCEMQKWGVNGLFRMALFALRDIEPGEELGYDYNFSLFNPAEGQPCKCGSSHCRGVIGGKSQRITAPIDDKNLGDKKSGRLKQNARKSKIKQKKASKMTDGSSALRSIVLAPMKPMSHQQRCFAQMHHCFLLRNLEKVKRLRERLKQAACGQQESIASVVSYGRPSIAISKASDVFLAQLNALSTPRSVRTRRLAQAEDDPELTKVARLAYVFKDLFQVVNTAKDEKGELLAAPFVLLPPKRKLPLYYERIQEPIDLTMLEKNITSGLYTTVEAFDQDFCRLFNNNVRFYGRTSELGIAAARLRKIYTEAKLGFQLQLEDILGETPPPSFFGDKNAGNVNKSSSGGGEDGHAEEEEIIRCICGLYQDEGLMIQCERCLVWQHAECVQADSSVEHYLCEMCVPRPVNRDILMTPQPEYAQPGETHYISLMREELQLRQGDTVYVLRDIIRDDIDDPTLPPQKHTYKTLRDGKPEDCDIFRIERLYTDESGARFAFGHHYLRPHETYHEPTRRFFPNEVMRVPLYEVVPFDLVLGQCWVLDLPTFCKGRPIGAKEEHVYVCEFRVDKTAHLFARLAPKTAKQSVAQLCLKPYAFEVFHTRLKPQRTYTPHGTSTPTVTTTRPRSKSRHNGEDDTCSTKSDASRTHSQQRQVRTQPVIPQQAPAVKRAKQRDRLNGVLLKLLDKQQCKQPLDASYLLESNRRQRKKPANLLGS